MLLDQAQRLNERYEVLGLLGKGGMGAVYRAHDHSLDRLVALKERIPEPGTLGPAKEHARQQFRREAQALAHLGHLNLPRIYDYFSLGDNEYIVMELIEGTTLSDYAQAKGVLPETLVLGWARQILDALGYLHSRNIIHRDIKPANLILTPDERVVLVDFGLSKLYDPNNQNSSTTLRGVGTPEYAPLEQYAREVGRTDARSDIYAVGATLYRLLAGKPPVDVHTRLLNSEALRSLSEINPTVSFNTAAVVERAMALYPQARYQTALDVQQAFGFTTGAPRTDKPSAAPLPAPPLENTPPPVGVEPIANAGEASRSLLSRLLPPLEPGAAGADNPPVPTAPAPSSGGGTTVEPAGGETTQLFDAPTQRLVRKPRAGLKLVRGILQVMLPGGLTLEFVRVPMGKFLMGSALPVDPAAQKDEMPQHTVELGEYWIGRFPVSVAQYTTFTNATSRQPPFDFPAKSHYPVVNVSWFDAAIYCQWLSEQSGKLVRLPTEAEWEKAARGTDGRLYPWGDEFDPARLNCAEGQRPGTTPLDQFPTGASPYGAMDMVGNTWEWNSDWFDPHYYAQAPAENPPGPDVGHYKALRGGAWFSDRAHVRAADRTNFNPENHYDYVGFRCLILPG
jgi:serine/threonine-protein kinase